LRIVCPRVALDDLVGEFVWSWLYVCSFFKFALPYGAAQGSIQFFHPFALMMIQSSACEMFFWIVARMLVIACLDLDVWIPNVCLHIDIETFCPNWLARAQQFVT
jgi:hypothetical protein